MDTTLLLAGAAAGIYFGVAHPPKQPLQVLTGLACAVLGFGLAYVFR